MLSVDNLEALDNQLRAPMGIVPFVGAGLSMAYGYPGWSTFLLKQALLAGVETETQALLDALQFEDAAQKVRDELGYITFKSVLEKTFGPAKLPNPLPVDTAAALLPSLSRGPVLTTNYDPVLERVFKVAGSEFEYVVWGARADIAMRSFRQDMRLLVKLHGDAADETDRVLTLEDYNRVYGTTASAGAFSPLPKLLSKIFSASRPLLFLGCSLSTDRTMAVLEQTASDFRAIEHYAILEAPADVNELRKRNRELSNRNIHAIWYPNGKHERLVEILKVLMPGSAALPSTTSSAAATAPITTSIAAPASATTPAAASTKSALPASILNPTDRALIRQSLMAQSQWGDTSDSRRKLVKRWLNVAHPAPPHVLDIVEHLGLVSPASAADEVMDELAAVEDASGGSALAAIVDQLTFKTYAERDALQAASARLKAAALPSPP